MEPTRRGEPDERYPETLTLIRHGQSRYNALKDQVKDLDEARRFRQIFDLETYDVNGSPLQSLAIDVLEKTWPSKDLHTLAIGYFKKIHALMHGISDYDTPLTDEGFAQAVKTGERMSEVVPKPDMIYYSPYLRTRQTMEAILSSAPPAWRDVPKWSNESIREQEHGMNTVFNDWRLSYVFEPMEMLNSMKQGEYAYRYKGGESRFDVRNRTSRFLGKLRRKHVGENVLAVTHHLTILATIGELLHWNREEFIEWDENRKPPNSSVTIFRRQPGVSRTGRDQLILDPKEYGMKLYEQTA